MNLSKVSTAALVEELKNREAVKTYTAQPYQPYQIIVGDKTVSDTGPAVILRIID